MPAKSQAQFRLLKGIAEGSIPPRGSLTQPMANEYVGHQSPKGLPPKVKPKKSKALQEALKK